MLLIVVRLRAITAAVTFITACFWALGRGRTGDMGTAGATIGLVEQVGDGIAEAMAVGIASAVGLAAVMQSVAPGAEERRSTEMPAADMVAADRPQRLM